MKKLFLYIENIWIGNDSKPSIRRLLALFFSIDLICNFHKLIDSIYKVIQTLILDKHMDAQVISAVSSLLANTLMIIGIEAGLIAGLLSLTTYQSLQLNKPYDSNLPYQNNEIDASIPKVPVGSTE